MPSDNSYQIVKKRQLMSSMTFISIVEKRQLLLTFIETQTISCFFINQNKKEFSHLSQFVLLDGSHTMLEGLMPTFHGVVCPVGSSQVFCILLLCSWAKQKLDASSRSFCSSNWSLKSLNLEGFGKVSTNKRGAMPYK